MVARPSSKSLDMSKTIQETLIKTKINPPRLSKELIERPRLLKRLQSPTGLILVVAPAGYGKTTLVSSWLESADMPGAWLSLSESDNNFKVFVNYLVSAVLSRFPKAARETKTLISTTAALSAASVSRTLINDLSSIRRDFVIVLDDYHHISNSTVHGLIAELLLNAPPKMHLVLLSRHDPVLPLPGLRARGQVTEIRAEDLSFTVEEVAVFFRDCLHIEVSDNELTSLRQWTEGWPVSLRLAAIHFRQTDSSSIIEANKRGKNKILLEYLVNEISSMVPEEVGSFLQRTSIIDQFNVSLCDAVMGYKAGSGKSQKHLDWLMKSGMFTLEIKKAPGWYRYHHLLRQFLITDLRHNLPPEEIVRLHLRASAWYDRQGMVEEAIRHALAAENIPAATGIYARHRREAMNQEEWSLLEQWLNMFPREVIDQQPEMLLTRLWFLFFRQQIESVPAVVTQVEKLLKHSDLEAGTLRRLQGELATRRALFSFYAGDGAQTILFAQEALEKLPEDWWHIRTHARFFLALGYQSVGNLPQAMETLLTSGDRDFGLRYRSRMFGLIMFIQWLAGDLSGIEEIAQKVRSWAEELDHPAETWTWVNYFLGIVYYHRNDFAKAENYLNQVIMHPYQAQASSFLHGCVAQAILYQVNGLPDKAQALVEVMTSYSLDENITAGMKLTGALKAELAIRHGNLTEAVKWAEQFTPGNVNRFPFFFAEPITYVKILLEQNTSTSLARARQVLTKLQKEFTEVHHTLWLISVLALQAMLEQKAGKKSKALKALKNSINLAEAGGFIRLYLDLGEPLQALLVDLNQQGIASDYIGRILAAFTEEKNYLKRSGNLASGSRAEIQQELGVTAREMDVLLLLGKRFTDKEIADTLYISKETVHTHIAHLGDKLNARGRRMIVQAASEAGLLN